MSFPRYSTYKPSGVEWFGEVPAHWKTVPLKTVATHNDEVLDETTAPDTEIAYVDIASVDGTNGIRTKETMQFCAAPSRARRRVKHGDVIVSTVRTYLKAIARIREPEENLVVSTGFAVLRPCSGLMPDFLGYLATASYFVEQVIARSTGVSYPAINASELVAIPVTVPPFGEQTQIVTFLDRETAKIDGLVAEQRRLIDLLKEKRQAVIAHAVTKGLNPNALMKPSGVEWLGDVPAHWTIERGRFLFQKLNLPPESEDGVVTAFRDGQVTLRENRRTDGFTFAVLELGYQRVRTGDLVIHGMDAFAGAIGVSESTGKCTPEYSVMTPARHGIDNGYFATTLRLMAQRNFIFVICPSVRERAPRFRFEAFKDVQLPVPPLEEQREIMRRIESASDETNSLIAETQRAVDLLQERRTTLISAAVAGQIDVRGEVAASSTVRRHYSSGFARQLLAAEILSRCHDHPTTGRVKLQKLIHLCEHFAEVEEVKAGYLRKAAGPFDNKLMFGIADGLSKQRWFSEVKDGKRTVYRALEKAGGHAKYLARWESKMPRIRKVLDLLGKAGTQQCEIVSTLYAAWNDLLIEKRSPSDAEIICEASDPGRWHKSKAKIPADKWPIALNWMREKRLIPTGFGFHTNRPPDEKETA